MVKAYPGRRGVDHNRLDDVIANADVHAVERKKEAISSFVTEARNLRSAYEVTVRSVDRSVSLNRLFVSCSNIVNKIGDGPLRKTALNELDDEFQDCPSSFNGISEPSAKQAASRKFSELKSFWDALKLILLSLDGRPPVAPALADVRDDVAENVGSAVEETLNEDEAPVLSEIEVYLLETFLDELPNLKEKEDISNICDELFSTQERALFPLENVELSDDQRLALMNALKKIISMIKGGLATPSFIEASFAASHEAYKDRTATSSPVQKSWENHMDSLIEALDRI